MGQGTLIPTDEARVATGPVEEVRGSDRDPILLMSDVAKAVWVCLSQRENAPGQRPLKGLASLGLRRAVSLLNTERSGVESNRSFFLFPFPPTKNRNPSPLLLECGYFLFLIKFGKYSICTIISSKVTCFETCFANHRHCLDLAYHT